MNPLTIKQLRFTAFAILLAVLATWWRLGPGLAMLVLCCASVSLQGCTYKLGALPNSALASATLNYQLTAYAQGLWNDLSDVVKLAERLAPTTPVPGASGQFKKFEDKNSFMPEKTARALGGDPTLIAFAADDDTYACKPQALEVRVDKIEDQQAGADGDPVAAQLLDEGKIRALMNKTALSHVLDVTTAVLAAVQPQPNLGNWSNPDIDPIDQLDQVLLSLSQNCGSTQNIKLTMDISAWNLLRTNPKVKARAIFGAGDALGSINMAQLAAALIFPVDIMAANVVYDQSRLGQAPNKARAMASVALVHYSVPGATLYDPSAFKSFTVGSGSPVGNVRTYVAPNELYRGHLVDWSRDIHQTSSLSMQRLNVN
jgi:hypothetical protein